MHPQGIATVRACMQHDSSTYATVQMIMSVMFEQTSSHCLHSSASLMLQPASLRLKSEQMVSPMLSMYAALAWPTSMHARTMRYMN